MATQIKRKKNGAAGSTLGVGIGIALALALFAMVNYLGLRHYQRSDWTSSRLYTLSEKSRQVLRQVDRDIDIVLLMNPEAELYSAVDELLSRYAAERPDHIRKRVIDSAKNLLEAQRLVEQFQIERENVIVLATENDRQVIDQFELADYDYSGAQYGQAPTMTGFKGEQEITSAIMELIASHRPNALFTQGHGEGSIEASGARSFSVARDLLGKDNFSTRPWSSLGQADVPEGTDLLVIAGPTSNFLPPELQSFRRYLDRGGRMLLLLDPAFHETGGFLSLGLEDWLATYGVRVGDNVVIDPARQMPFFGPETLYTEEFGPHPIVDPLAHSHTPVLIPLARSVARGEDVPPEIKIAELIHSSPEAWGETRLDDLENLAQDEDEDAGPISLAVALSFPVPAAPDPVEPDPAAPVPAEPEDVADTGMGEARLVVFGDADFATDAQVANAGNTSLLLNSLNWLVQRESMITIEARRPKQTRLNLNRSELTTIYFLVLLLLPALAVGIGIAVYLRRRR